MKTQIFNHRFPAIFIATVMLAGFAQGAFAQRHEKKNEHQNRQSQRENPNKDKAKALKNDLKPGKENFNFKPGRENRHEEWKKKPGYYHNPRDFKKQHRPDFYKRHHNPIVHVHVSPRVHPEWNRHTMPHISFRHLPRTAVWVSLDGEGYFFCNKRFYKASPFGYYRVHPPRYIRVLPEGCQLVFVKGHPAFRYFGIYFIKTPFGFEIVS